MKRIVLARAAASDIDGIEAFTRERWGESQAQEYVIKLSAAVGRIAARPEIGRRYVELGIDLRRIVAGRHVIFYEDRDDHVLIVRILHERMDFSRHLDDDEDGPPFTP
jgi:toxin ParE1/3/4